MAVDDKSGDESAFVARLVAREEAAFTELISLYQDRVFAVCFRLLGRREEARDVSQEVFVQVFRAIDSFRGESKLSTWLFRVAVNLCKNRMKRHARRGGGAHQDLDAISDHKALDGGEGVTVGSVARPDQLLEGIQLEAVVKRAIAEIDPDFRRLVVLRDVEGLTYEEIADVTGLARGTVKSRIHRGRAQLRARVETLLGEKLGKVRNR